MHSSIYLTVLVVLSLILPDFINLVTSNFSIIDAELKYYRNMGNELQKYKDSLVESLKAKYGSYYNSSQTNSKGDCKDSEREFYDQSFYTQNFESIQKQQNDRSARAQTGDDIAYEKFVNQKVSELAKRFVSKTSKNEIILDQYNDKVYLISIDNKFLFTDEQSYSFLSIMEMYDDKLFGNISYERNSDIQWNLCTLHKIRGIIKDIQFDQFKQSFSILYIDVEQQTQIRIYNTASFCKNSRNPNNSQGNSKSQSGSDNQDQVDAHVQQMIKMYSQRYIFRMEELFKITKNTKYDAKNYLEINMNKSQIQKMAYSKNIIIYSAFPDSSLIKAIKVPQEGEEITQIRNVNMPNYSYIEKDYVQVLNIQIIDSHGDSELSSSFLVTLLKGFNEEIFIECELYKIKFDSKVAEETHFEENKFFFTREEAQTLFSKNVTSFIRNLDIFENNLFPHIQVSYSKQQSKFVMNILDQHLMLLDFSLPTMIGIVDIEPSNYSRLMKEGYKIKKIQFSENGNFLCVLAHDQDQNNQMFLLEMSKTNNIHKFQTTEMFQIKEIRDRIKNLVIKDFSTYEGDENSQSQLNSVLLLEGGEVVNMSLCTNCTNKFKKSVVKELVDIFSTLLISIGFIILFICAKQLMANIDEEQEDF